MGQNAVITAKNKSTEVLNLLNEDLKKSGFTKTSFITERKVNKWYKNVLNDLGYDYKHIREKNLDENGNFTLESYKKFLKTFGEEIGVLVFDYAFNRTSTRQLEKVARFIYDRKEYLEPVRGMKDILERGKAPKYIIEALKDFEFVSPPPEKLPKEEQYRPTIQGGNLLCKSWSPNPFWVVFGKVETPTFMKVRIYENDLMNNIYKDKQKLSYLLIPQITMDGKKFGTQTKDEFFKNAWEMGLREHPNFFFPFVYNFHFADETEESLQEVADEFSSHYTSEELWERFLQIQRQINTGGGRHSVNRAVVQLEKVLRRIPSVEDKIKK